MAEGGLPAKASRLRFLGSEAPPVLGVPAGAASRLSAANFSNPEKGSCTAQLHKSTHIG